MAVAEIKSGNTVEVCSNSAYSVKKNKLRLYRETMDVPTLLKMRAG